MPVQYLPKVSAKLGVDVYIKRDDLTGFGIGGNKVRKLEFLLGDVMAKGCDTVVTTGAVHSNHAFVTALAAKSLGLDAVLVLRGGTIGGQLPPRQADRDRDEGLRR